MQVSYNGTLIWNQLFPLPYVVSGIFTQISIIDVFPRFCGFRKTDLLIHRDQLDVYMKCRIFHLMLVYDPLECCEEMRLRKPLLTDSVYAETLTIPCRHVVETR